MTYREAPAPAPMILSMSTMLVAVDPASGRCLWQQSMATAKRLFVVGPSLFVVQEVPSGGTPTSVITCLDLRTGQSRGALELEFAITAGIASGEHLFVAGLAGAANINSQGGIVWKATVEEEGLLGTTSSFVCKDASGTELWRAPYHWSEAADNAGIVLGDRVFQPDLHR